jgi:hypothetical protein
MSPVASHTTPVVPPPPKMDAAPTGKRPQEVHDPPVRTAFAFDAMETALAAFARGEFVVVMDDEARENEGDLIIAAHACGTAQMAWMIKHTRYVVWAAGEEALAYERV